MCNPATPGDGSSAAPIQIFSPDEFYSQLGSGLVGKEYILCADLDFGGATRSSITRFSGILRGGGHSLSNLNISGHGLFKILENATIDGLALQGFVVMPNSSYPAGVLAGLGTNVEVGRVGILDSRVNSSVDGPIGGLFGQISGCTRAVNLTYNHIQNVYLKTSRAGNPVAGFVGVFYQEYFDHVLSNNSVEVTLDLNSRTYCVGGFVGYTSQGILRENSVSVRFSFPGDYERSGGFLGCTEMGQASSRVHIASNRIQFDTLYGNSFGRVGGIVGALESQGSVELVSNWVDGRVDAAHSNTKGMLVGHFDSGSLFASDNYWNSSTGSLPAIQSPSGYTLPAGNTGVTATTASAGTPFSGGEWSNSSIWEFRAGAFPELVNTPR